MMTLLIASAVLLLIVVPFILVVAACVAAGRSDQRDERLAQSGTRLPMRAGARITAGSAGD